MLGVMETEVRDINPDNWERSTSRLYLVTVLI